MNYVWKRIRKRPAKKPDPIEYKAKKKALKDLEKQAELGVIDLYYGDSTTISQMGNSPYGWQKKAEEINIPVTRGKSISCFGLFSRNNDFYYKITTESIKSDFILGMLDEFSLMIDKKTVLVLDNARPHKAKKVMERLKLWEKRGLYIFFLPVYSPQLNLIERLWEEFKLRWLRPSDYVSADDLFYAVNRICNAVGSYLFLNISCVT